MGARQLFPVNSADRVRKRFKQSHSFWLWPMPTDDLRFTSFVKQYPFLENLSVISVTKNASIFRMRSPLLPLTEMPAIIRLHSAHKWETQRIGDIFYSLTNQLLHRICAGLEFGELVANFFRMPFPIERPMHSRLWPALASLRNSEQSLFVIVPLTMQSVAWRCFRLSKVLPFDRKIREAGICLATR
jgi:hypothetical protein